MSLKKFQKDKKKSRFPNFFWLNIVPSNDKTAYYEYNHSCLPHLLSKKNKKNMQYR